MPIRAVPALLLAALALPASAGAATLTVDHRCYVQGDPIKLVGSGFTPGGLVSFTLGGRPYGSSGTTGAGGFTARGRAPAIRGGFERLRLVATEAAAPARAARTSFLVTRRSVSISPQLGGRPDRRVTFGARGFPVGRTLYVHYISPRHAVLKTVRLGALKGPCGTRARRAALIPYPDARVGRWELVFDTRRAYSSRTTRAQVRLSVRVR